MADEEAPAELRKWRERSRELERELSRLRMQLVSGGDSSRELEVDGVKLVVREVPAAPVHEIRNMADVLRSRLGSGVVVLGSREREKVTLVAAVSEDLTARLHAGRLAESVARLVGGGGGGRADFAQAGGREPEKLAAALDQVPELIRHQLNGS